MGVKKTWVGVMAYETLGDGALDYFPCRYNGSRVLFRGPHRRADGNFVVVLGGTEAYGKFVPRPYPALLEAGLGLPVLNLGYPNAGPDLYLNAPEVMALVARARLCIIQIPGATNLSNRYFTVHPRRNDRFLGVTPALRSLFRDVDFTEFHFTRHMLQGLGRVSPDRLGIVVQELRQAWAARMRSLLRALPGSKVLLWVDTLPPPAAGAGYDLARGTALVDRDMIAALTPLAEAYVEVRPSTIALGRGTAGMVFSALDEPMARLLPNAAVHAEIADVLQRDIRHLLATEKGA